ncbi:MAG: SusF/SusE family outer membrane protein [Saprospiraceae bacterium]|nr:SusF/SusE family outer membrane protein [Saprospiraceae bacterium]
MKSLKLNFLSKTLSILLLMSFVFVSCSDDDPDDVTPTPKVEDGVYIKGAGTAFAEFSTKALFKVTRNEVLQKDRPELLEVFMAIKKGTDGFNIIDVKGTTQTVYGPGSDWKLEATPGVDDPKDGLWKGNLAASASKFTVPEDGLYHIVVDFGVKKVTMARVKWGVIGGATPDGWSGSTAMTQSAFDLNKISFKVEKLVLLKNEWKFRYSSGWKIELDANLDLGGGQKGVKVNTNLGGTLSALVAGGDNIKNDVYGEYTVELIWEAGVGYKATATKTGEGPILAAYPDNLYVIGDGVGGWEWKKNDIQLIPVHSNPHLFWRIVWLEKDKGFKFSPVQDWKGDFGQDKSAPVNGVYKKGGDNVPVTGATGYYMIVVNLKTETIEVVAPNVFLIGDAVANWDAANPANKFTVGTDINITKALTADKEIRMHVTSPTMKNEKGDKASDWWQSEFIVLNGKIEYRGKGNDQARVKSKASGNTTIKLDFKAGTGTIQ